MTQTTNYQLPKWEKTDRIQMSDFNDMTAALDAALKANADAAAAASAAVALCGNCRIETSTYTGTGSAGAASPTTLTFPKKPTLVVVFGHNSLLLISDKCGSKGFGLGFNSYGTIWRGEDLTVAWTGSTLKYYCDYDATQANVNGKVYQVIAFYAQDK